MNWMLGGVAEETGFARFVATGGPDGAGCREGDDFRLMFAWDEVGNLLAVERQRLVEDEACTAPGGGIEILDPEFEEFLVPGADREDYEWCPAARLESAYDFGGQRRVKREANITDDVGRIPEGASLYVSASYEVREAVLDDDVWGGEDVIDARYLWNEAGILFELDSEVPDGAPSPKTRLTLTNQIGSASSVLDADLGSVSQILSQLPYGAEEQAFPRVDPEDPPAFVPRYEFTGKERDRGVGLVYFGARSLDARLGRWVSADRKALHGGARDANAFRSAGANPIAFLDPDGCDIYAYNALEHTIRSIAGVSDAELAAVVQRAAGTVHSLDPQIQPGAVAQEYVWRAMQVQAAALGGGDELAAELIAAFSTTSLAVTQAEGGEALRQELVQRFGAKELWIFDSFYRAASHDATVVVARVRDDPTYSSAAITETGLRFQRPAADGTLREVTGQLVVVPAGGAYSQTTGRSQSESDLVGTEFAHHVGAALEGVTRSENEHGDFFQWRLLDFVERTGGDRPTGDPNTSDLAPLAYLAASEQASQGEPGERPRPADERALKWGQALAAFYNAQPLGGVSQPIPADASAPAGGTSGR